MAITFPASPSVNDTFTEGSITYKCLQNEPTKWIGLGVTPADRLVEGSNNLEIDSNNNLIWTGNNVGIGVTTPNVLNEPAKFTELTLGGKNEGASITLKDNNDNVQGGLFTSDNTGAMIIRTITNHPLMFRTNNTEKLRITTNGNLIAGADDATHPNEFAYNDTSASNNTYLELYGGTSAGNRGILSLAGRTGSDGGDLGTIWFINGNNAGASPGSNMKLAAAIQSQSVTDNNNSQGNSGAYLQFMTKAQGGSLTEHFRFTETGKLHRPSLGTQNNPARSAQHLYDSGITTDGNYYLQSPSMTAPALVRCVFHDNRGWMIILQHECVDVDGLPLTLLQNKVGTPNFTTSDFQGCEQTDGLAFTPLNMWQAFGTNGEESLVAMYAREIQTSGGSYDETQTYSSYTGGVIWNQTTFSRLFSGGFSDGVFRTSLRVTHNNGASTKYSKKGTTWSSPALATINNGQVDQDLYFCNGEDGGDTNWSFALMQGGTPYPKNADAANGGGRNSITRWAIIGICEV